TNTGYQSAATNTGDQSAAEVGGQHSIALAAGAESKARASEGSAIALCYRNDEGELIHIRAAIAGQGEIEPNKWYSLNESGEFVCEESAEEVEPA
ncbi:hypothetical protein MO867_22395, partial [Microbulbifer sp. OS29]